MKDDITKRIDACIEAENISADIYNCLSIKFPRERVFFKELSREEENHATILQVARSYHDLGKLPRNMVPGHLPDIYATINLLKSMRDKITSSDVSLREAIEMSLELESAVAESYLQETLTKDTDDRVVRKLQKLLIDEQHHADKIREYMKNKTV